MFKLAPARLKKGMALIELTQKTPASRNSAKSSSAIPAPKKSAAPAPN